MWGHQDDPHEAIIYDRRRTLWGDGGPGRLRVMGSLMQILRRTSEAIVAAATGMASLERRENFPQSILCKLIHSSEGMSKPVAYNNTISTGLTQSKQTDKPTNQQTHKQTHCKRSLKRAEAKPNLSSRRKVLCLPRSPCRKQVSVSTVSPMSNGSLASPPPLSELFTPQGLCA